MPIIIQTIPLAGLRARLARLALVVAALRPLRPPPPRHRLTELPDHLRRDVGLPPHSDLPRITDPPRGFPHGPF